MLRVELNPEQLAERESLLRYGAAIALSPSSVEGQPSLSDNDDHDHDGDVEAARMTRRVGPALEGESPEGIQMEHEMSECEMMLGRITMSFMMLSWVSLMIGAPVGAVLLILSDCSDPAITAIRVLGMIMAGVVSVVPCLLHSSEEPLSKWQLIRAFGSYTYIGVSLLAVGIACTLCPALVWLAFFACILGSLFVMVSGMCFVRPDWARSRFIVYMDFDVDDDDVAGSRRSPSVRDYLTDFFTLRADTHGKETCAA